MSPLRSLGPSITRRNLITVLVLEVALFLLAGVTAKSHNHPGAISNAFWVVFLIGAALLIVLTATALIRKRLAGR